MGSSSRVLLTIVICIGILFAWHYLFPPKVPLKQQKISGKETKVDRGSVESRARGKASSSSVADAAAGKESRASGPLALKRDPSTSQPAAMVEGPSVRFSTKEAVLRFTSSGGSLRSWELKDPRYKEFRDGKLRQVNLVQTIEDKGLWPLETTFIGSDFDVPPRAVFSKVRSGNKDVVFQWESEKVRVLKHYVLDASRSVIWLALKVKNLTQTRLKHRLQLSLYGRQDPALGKASFSNPFPKISTIMCHVNGELHRRSADSIMGEDSGCSAAGCGMGNGPLIATGEVLWIGSGDRYFLTGLVPQDMDAERRCELQVMDGKVIHAALQFSEGVLEPQDSFLRRFAIFVGPKDLSDLDAVKGPEKQETKLGESIEFGWFAVLCRPMLWLMKVFHGWFGNWGIAIILLTLIVKLLTLYWTQKSMRSMREMQRLKPKMDELREKFKEDKQRLNQEMMALYKVHKVNPLGGCLPMIIQMPVWFALYRTLGNSVELYRSSFFGWITDLTAPDPFYVLPVAMGISMYAQQAISPQPMEGTQAKLMKYFMPGMFTVMMLWLPSGLTLYIFVNTVLTMIHQWYMNKTDKNRPQAEQKTVIVSEGSSKTIKKIRGNQGKKNISNKGWERGIQRKGNDREPPENKTLTTEEVAGNRQKSRRRRRRKR